MKPRIHLFFVAALASILLSSCFSINNFQTAKTLKKGQTELGLGVAAGTSFTIDADPQDTIDGLGNLGYPLADIILFGRYGISENFDLGLRLSALGDIGIDGKWMLVGDQNSAFTFSPGLGVSSNLRLGTAVNMYQVEVPLHTSYNFSDNFSVFLTPRYVGQSAQFTIFETDENWLDYIGGSLGMEFGQKIRFIVGGNYLRSLNYSELNNFNVGAGIKYRFGGENKASK